MKERTQHQLVGTLVLASLAAIVLPEILKNPRDYSITRHVTPIPALPPALQSNKLEIATDNEPLIPPLETDLSDTTEQFTAIESPVQVDSKLTAWVVQVATFTSKKKAERLQSSLRKKGFPAFMQSNKSEKKTIYKVQVGPELNQAQAESVASEVKQKFKLTGQIEPYVASD